MTSGNGRFLAAPLEGPLPTSWFGSALPFSVLPLVSAPHFRRRIRISSLVSFFWPGVGAKLPRRQLASLPYWAPQTLIVCSPLHVPASSLCQAIIFSKRIWL